jgi:hypothetical protein
MRVQGTIVALSITFDAAPPDVQIAVQPPDPLPVVVGKLSTGEVTANTDGTYAYAIDTTPAPGRWEYEVASIGGLTNVRKQRAFDVRPMIGP